MGDISNIIKNSQYFLESKLHLMGTTVQLQGLKFSDFEIDK